MTFKKIISYINPIHKLIFGFPGQRFFITHYPLSETKQYYTFIQDNIEKINKYSELELGAKFILLVFPRSYQYNEKECPNNWEKAEYQILGEYAYEPFKYFDHLKKAIINTLSIYY